MFFQEHAQLQPDLEQPRYPLNSQNNNNTSSGTEVLRISLSVMDHKPLAEVSALVSPGGSNV